MGGVSTGRLTRESFFGRVANVMRGHVSLKNNGGFVQMVTNLALDPVSGSVDASAFEGVELDVCCDGVNDDGQESFNIQ